MAIKPPETKKSTIRLEPHQVVLRPLVTEKGVHRVERHNQYAFEVSPLADKSDVKSAIEELFDVKVLKVRTQNRKGSRVAIDSSTDERDPGKRRS